MGRETRGGFDPSEYFTKAPAEGLMDTEQYTPKNEKPESTPEQTEQPAKLSATTEGGENVVQIEPLAQRRDRQEMNDMGGEVIAMADSMGDRRGHSAADLGITKESLLDPDLVSRLQRHTKFKTLPQNNQNTLLKRITETQRRMGMNQEAA